MPRRFQISDHKIAYDFIAARDGERCLECGRRPPAVKLQIDHADKNPENNSPANLHFLCAQHNIKLGKLTPSAHKKHIQTIYAKYVCVSECVNGIESTRMVRELVDYKSGTTEMQANSYYEVEFREWLLSEIKRLKSISTKEAINSGAEVVGCSPVTIRRYIDKLTSSVGILREKKDQLGVKMLTVRTSS